MFDRKLSFRKKRWGELEAVIGQEEGYLKRRMASREKANFVYLQPRLISPEIANQVRELKFSGVGFEKQLSRFILISRKLLIFWALPETITMVWRGWNFFTMTISLAYRQAENISRRKEKYY